MSLEPFCRSKLVVLHPGATVYEAARALRENHVGALLITEEHHLVGIVTDRDLATAMAAPGFDFDETRLSAVMTDVVGSCDVGAPITDVVCTMIQFACRRVPVTRDNRPVGLVTLDDLILDGELDAPTLRAIVTAQLEQPSRLKPAGEPRPARRPSTIPPAERRRAARAEQTYGKLVHEVERRTKLSPRLRAEAALKVVLEMLCKRLRPDDARHLMAELPSRLRIEIESSLDGPHKEITIDTIAAELRSRVQLPPDVSLEVLVSVCDTIANGLSEGGLESLRGHLPGYMKDLFPRDQGRERDW